ncbi:hypothetical protein FZC33_01510 [Labrys sp. KNU-23]|uniref:hypothetical protein n=1 Tax=Labrys sp. KNU-23 TaxID=2789216 RepID=UPI0011EBD239|nr:hypothetical protein [Labrys sp. KNU-23]QEN84976.1 hypothetical protein FZC33_01510 [Labrys sp. KNU-23]
MASWPQPDVQEESAHAWEQDRPDILKRCRACFDSRFDFGPARLVFIGRDGAYIEAALRLPGGLAFCIATGNDGLHLSGMVAPFVYDGAMNSNVFPGYVERVLVSTLELMALL